MREYLLPTASWPALTPLVTTYLSRGDGALRAGLVSILCVYPVFPLGLCVRLGGRPPCVPELILGGTRGAVQVALHANVTLTGGRTINECSDRVNDGLAHEDLYSVAPLLPDLLDRFGLRILFYSGQVRAPSALATRVWQCVRGACGSST